MVRPGLVVLVALAAALAGCAGAPTDEAPASVRPSPGEPAHGRDAAGSPDAREEEVAPAAAGAPAPPALTQSGCSSFYSSHAVDAAYAEARLPEGLEPVPYQSGVLFTLKAWSCPAGEDGGDAFDAAQAIVYYLAVDPAAHLDADHVGFSWYPLEVVTTSPALAAGFERWGFRPVVGEVAIGWNEGFDPWVVQVEAAAVDAAVTIPSFGSEDGDFTVRYFAGDAERVTGAVDIVVHPGSRGGGGPTLLRIEGEHAPAPAPLAGLSGYQGWDAGALSYTWTGVDLE